MTIASKPRVPPTPYPAKPDTSLTCSRLPSRLRSQSNIGSRNRDLRRATALVSFSCDYLIVVRSQLESKRGPSIEVRSNVDRASNTMVLSYGPVLLECRSSDDRWLVGSGRLQDLVCRPVGRDGSDLACGRAGIISAERLTVESTLDTLISGGQRTLWRLTRCNTR